MINISETCNLRNRGLLEHWRGNIIKNKRTNSDEEKRKAYNKYHREYYHKNKEILLNRQKKYRTDNELIYKKRRREYINKNKERIRAQEKEYNIKNKEWLDKYQKIYRKKYYKNLKNDEAAYSKYRKDRNIRIRKDKHDLKYWYIKALLKTKSNDREFLDTHKQLFKLKRLIREKTHGNKKLRAA